MELLGRVSPSDKAQAWTIRVDQIKYLGCSIVPSGKGKGKVGGRWFDWV